MYGRERERGVGTGFRWGNLREIDHLEDTGVDGKINKMIYRKWDMGVWTGSIWLRKEKGGGHL